jgi:hypothetical protein
MLVVVAVAHRLWGRMLRNQTQALVALAVQVQPVQLVVHL